MDDLRAPRLIPTDAPDLPDAIPLYPDTVAPAQTTEVWERFAPPGVPLEAATTVVRNVTTPTLVPILPDPQTATGAAVIIVPGGAFKMVGIEHEGTAVARRLAKYGIAAFVLKYRSNETPADPAGALQQIMAVLATAAGQPDGGISEPRAVLDIHRALDLLRAQAADWQLDPARIGLIGFSAGAIAVKRAVLTAGTTRPAFIGHIYGSMLAEQVPADAPPMFAALGLDDMLFGKDGFGLVESWHRAGVPVEFHAYERGNHGFGVGLPGTTSTGMIDQFVDWLTARKLLGGQVVI